MKEIFDDFVNSGAILKGHFILASGLHSDTYIQCAKLLQHPQLATKAANALINKIPQQVLKQIDIVVAPAMGGLIIGFEVARLINKDFIFFERVNNIFTLKRGFKLEKNAKVLLVEDVITTGGSSLEVASKVLEQGAKVSAEATLIDRSGKNCTKDKFSFDVYSLIDLQIDTFKNSDLPEALKKIPPQRLGSKKI